MIKKLLFVFLLLFQFQLNAQVAQKTALTPLPGISIIGTSVGGWDIDVALQTTDGENYYLSAKELLIGGLKFRSNQSWTQNWGSIDFPSGIGTQGGQDIPIAEQATYNINFNVLTGAYHFEKVCVCPTLYAPVCANGKFYSNECVAKCAGETTWINGMCEPTDVNVYISGSAIGEKQKMPRGGVGFVLYDADVFEGIFTLNNGELHFEVQDQDMLYYLSGTTFPSGTANMNYDTMIPVKAGKYAVRINIKTKEYRFIATPSVSIADVNLTQLDNQGNYEAKNIFLDEVDVTVFDMDYGNDALMVLYGNNFPSGVATMEVFTPVKVIPGYYNIYYNTNTKEYRFEEFDPIICGCMPIEEPVCANGKTYLNKCEASCAGEITWVEGACNEEFPVITITGTAVGGWDKDVEMITSDGINYILEGYYDFVEGEFKFRQDFDWKINWGGTTVPEGVGLQGGSNIPMKYTNIEKIDFNRVTGAYTVYCLYTLDMNPVCVNGKTYSNWSDALCQGVDSKDIEDGACKETYIDIFGSAVGDPVRMVFENGVYTVKNKSLTYGDVYFGGKFEGKSIQIGGNSFPTGIAEFDEKPVLAEEGEYDIVLKLGEGGNTYTFTKKFMGVAAYGNHSVWVTPNPVKDILNISSDEYTQAEIYDYTGRLVKSVAITHSIIDFSGLAIGNYILKIQSLTNQETIKIVKE